jgi:hypothetical protein
VSSLSANILTTREGISVIPPGLIFNPLAIYKYAAYRPLTPLTLQVNTHRHGKLASKHHPRFRERHQWRRPVLPPRRRRSSLLTCQVVTVQGTLTCNRSYPGLLR